MSAARDKDKAKRFAAYLAVDENVKSNQIIGIGSGSTIIYAVQRIAELYAAKKVQNITCIPTSFQSERLIIQNHLPLGNLKLNWKIDIDFDGADEVDAHLNCIKGGGGCHLHEKMVAYNAKKIVIIADYSKQSKNLCTNYKKGVPISVVSDSIGYLQHYMVKHLKENIRNLSDRNIKCNLRMAQNKAGPVMTDDGHMMHDIDFDGVLDPNDIESINNVLKLIPGVVETGLFVGMAEIAYFGQIDGSVIKQTNDGIIRVKPKTIFSNDTLRSKM